MEIKLHPKQLQVLNAVTKHHAQEIFFGGAAGGGKSYLIRAIAVIWCVQVPGVQVYIFRRLFKDLLRSHMQGPGSLPGILKDFVEDKLVKINYSSNEINFVNGSRIVLAHIQYESDLNNYLSQEIHIALFDEASTFLEKMFRFIRSRVRIGGLQIPPEFAGCLPFIVLASNPRGPMHAYLKKSFVTAAKPGTIFVAPPQDGGARRIFIPSHIVDNPTLMKNDPDYRNRLMGLGDEQVTKAYLDGDWDAVEGQALPQFERVRHVIPAFDIPRSWTIKRCYDYGFSAPYSVLWLAVSNGDDAIVDGKPKSYPPKATFVVRELYGDDGAEGGLKENVRVTAKKMREIEYLSFGPDRVVAGPADNAIFSSEQGPSIYDIFLDEHLEFSESNKRPGSRVLGLAITRQMLEESSKPIPEKECLFIFDCCIRLPEHLATLQLDTTGEDVASTGQPEHDWDALRYGILDVSDTMTTIKVSGV